MRPGQHRGRLRRLEQQVPSGADNHREWLPIVLTELVALADAYELEDEVERDRAVSEAWLKVRRRHASGDTRGITLEQLAVLGS